MASGGGDVRSLRVESYVRGYHVYQRIWNPFVGGVAVAVCPAEWQRLVYTLRAFASISHSYLLLEIFHTGTNEGIILIMCHIERFF